MINESKLTTLNSTSLILLMDKIILSNIDEKNDSLYLMIGYKYQRKSIIKYMIRLKMNILSCFVNISKSNDISHLSITEEKSLFLGISKLINTMPYGLVFLGFVHFTLNTNDLQRLNTSNIKESLTYFIPKLKDTDMICLAMNRISKNIIYIKSAFVENIDFLCKVGIFQRHPIVEIKLDSLISFSRLLYINLSDLNKDFMIKYTCKIIENIIQSSYTSYEIKGSMLIKPVMISKSSYGDMLLDNDYNYLNNVAITDTESTHAVINMAILLNLHNIDMENIENKHNNENDKTILRLSAKVKLNFFINPDENIVETESYIKDQIIAQLKDQINVEANIGERKEDMFSYSIILKEREQLNTNELFLESDNIVDSSILN